MGQSRGRQRMPEWLYQLEEISSPPEPFPDLLSETGIFTDTESLVPAPGIIELDINAPYWSDGARKRRWIALPGASRIHFDDAEAWEFPVGTILVKHFELDLAPQVTRRLETRVLLRHATGWQGYTYRWNDAENDAALLSAAETAVFTVADPEAPGGTRDQTWLFPSQAQCRNCHTDAAGVVLGVRTRQIHRDFSYGLVADDQLRSWNHIGLFDIDIGSSNAYDAYPNPFDATQPLGRRARAYLASNCAQCHIPGGSAPGALDFRFEAGPSGLGVNVPPASGDLGLTDPLIIRPRSKESSVLWERLRRLDGERMPPLASSVVDRDAVDLLGAWIDAGAE